MSNQNHPFKPDISNLRYKLRLVLTDGQVPDISHHGSENWFERMEKFRAESVNSYISAATGPARNKFFARRV